MLGTREKESIIRNFEPVPGNSEETAKRMVGWSQVFFGDPLNRAHYWIRTGSIPLIHKNIYQALAEEDKFIVITSPRGFAKTTIDSLVYPLYRIYYQLDPVIIIIGEIADSAKRILKNIKKEIAFNPKLIEVYGQLKPDNPKSSLWSAHEVETSNGVFIRSIGMVGDIRGSLDSMYRPTLIIIDDPQSKRTLREPATLEAHEEYFDSDVVYALDEEHGKIRLIGNLISRNCLLAKVIKDKRFKVIQFSAIVNNKGQSCKTFTDIRHGESTWEEKFPTIKLREEASHLLDIGKFHVFLLERQNVIAEQFEKNLRGYRFHNLSYERCNDQNVLIGDEYPEPIRVNTFLSIDPAFASTEDSDERALILFAKGRVLKRNYAGSPYWFNSLWVLEYIYNHMQPDEIIDESLEFHKKYYFSDIILEAISGAQIYDPLMQKAIVSDEFFSRFPFNPVFVKYQPQNKKDRIFSGLQPRCKLGQILIRESHKELRDEFDNFEMYQSPHLSDALEMGNRFSYECTEQFSNMNDRQRGWIRKQERQEIYNNEFYNTPQTLESIL